MLARRYVILRTTNQSTQSLAAKRYRYSVLRDHNLTSANSFLQFCMALPVARCWYWCSCLLLRSFIHEAWFYRTVSSRKHTCSYACITGTTAARKGGVHTSNVTAYRKTVSWQCGRNSWPRNVSKVGYAVTLRGHESRPHCHDTVLRYAVTLQVCTHPKSARRNKLEKNRHNKNRHNS
jgi:hypothetical protein